jgi:hypothetical protein
MNVVLQKPTVAHLIKEYILVLLYIQMFFFFLLYIGSLFNEAVNNSDHTDSNALRIPDTGPYSQIPVLCLQSQCLRESF